MTSNQGGSREGVNGAQEGEADVWVCDPVECPDSCYANPCSRPKPRPAACNDRLSDHGDVGPCVLSGRHATHDDGRGVTWSRKEVP
jgi:hypothetical protein